MSLSCELRVSNYELGIWEWILGKEQFIFSGQENDQFRECKMVRGGEKELVQMENEELHRGWPCKVFSHV